MIKKLLLSLAVLSFVGCGGSLRGTPVRDSSELVSHLGSSTVALMAPDEDGDMRVFCSGVWVSENQILTAGHCAAAAARIAYKVEDEDAVVPIEGVKIHYSIESEVTVGQEPTAIHLGTVFKVDEGHDLALIKVELSGMPEHQYARLAKTMPALGEKVSVVGHPKGLYYSYIEGVVSSYRTDLPGKDGKWVQVSAPVWFGNSGGGVFDYCGNLVGIASFIVRMPNVGFFVHIDQVKSFIKQ